jgi:hypothetical protein
MKANHLTSPWLVSVRQEASGTGTLSITLPFVIRALAQLLVAKHGVSHFFTIFSSIGKTKLARSLA